MNAEPEYPLAGGVAGFLDGNRCGQLPEGGTLEFQVFPLGLPLHEGKLLAGAAPAPGKVSIPEKGAQKDGPLDGVQLQATDDNLITGPKFAGRAVAARCQDLVL